jgi:hypothetical protein
MSVTLLHVNSEQTRVYMGTITGGVNVHEALAEMARVQAIQTATIELLGGLHEVELTAYDFEQQLRQPPMVFTRPLEIIAGQGTISLLDGRPHIHLHMALAFRDTAALHGITVIGGHVARALAFAVEFTLTAYEGTAVHRALHPPTGLQLWQLPGNSEQ